MTLGDALAFFSWCCLMALLALFAFASEAEAHNCSHAQNCHKWERVALQCEVVGLPHPWQTNTHNGFYGGLQFKHTTWWNLVKNNRPANRYWNAHLAPKWLQINMAEKHRRAHGLGAWPHCRRYWY